MKSEKQVKVKELLNYPLQNLSTSLYIDFSNPVNCIVLSKDNKTVVVSGMNFICKIQIAPFRVLKYVEINCDIWKITFSSSEMYLFLASNETDNSIFMHNAENLNYIRTIHGHTNFVSEIIVLKKLPFLVSSSSDKKIIFYNAFDFSIAHTVTSKDQWFRTLLVNKEETLLYGGGENNYIVIFDLNDFSEKKSKKMIEGIFSLTFGKNEEVLYVGMEKGLMFLNSLTLDVKRYFNVFQDWIWGLYSFYDDKFVIASSDDHCVKSISNMKTNQYTDLIRHSDRVFDVKITAEGYLLTASQDETFGILKTRVVLPKLTINDAEIRKLIRLKSNKFLQMKVRHIVEQLKTMDHCEKQYAGILI